MVCNVWKKWGMKSGLSSPVSVPVEERRGDDKEVRGRGEIVCAIGWSSIFALGY